MRNKRHFKGNNKAQDKAKRRENAEKWASVRGDDANRNGYDTPTENERLEAFYKSQNFVSPDEWDSFMAALRAPLPACFRINPNYVFADELRKQLHEFAGQSFEVDGVQIHAVEQMGWYPNGCGYKLGTDRRNIRKLKALEGLHQWLIQHTNSGDITRQEAVSMVPPLALNVESHHKCLDMCAAPGSKTSQLLEAVEPSIHSGGAQGLVVANDADTDRAYMLSHQCKRMNSPLLVITTHKGQMFPPLQPGDLPSSVKDGYFDRVLCDVPCSGDGTLRKNPAIWSKWTTASALTIHPLQLMIALRGYQLLKTDGLMVYSTCSMSPYENEAVVAELLRSSKGTLELVDAREFMPEFKARRGLSHWYVFDDYRAIKRANKTRKLAARESRRSAAATAGAVATSAEAEGVTGEDKEENDVAAASGVAASDALTKEDEEEEPAIPGEVTTHSDPFVQACLDLGMQLFEKHEDVPEYLDRKLRKSVFPPTAEEAAWMHLDRCLRCVPHDEDTGGFFVATLRKVVGPETARSLRKKAAQEAGSATVNDDEIETGAADIDTAVDVDVGNAVAEDGEDEEGSGEKSAKRAKLDDGNATPAAAKSKFASHRGLVDFKQWDAENFQKVQKFYGFSEGLPAEALFVREDFCTTQKDNVSSKSVYYMPPSSRDLLRCDKEGKLKMVTAGIKVFEKKVNKQGPAEYRLVQEGLSVLMPFITARRIKVPIQDFCNMMSGGLVSFNTLSPETVSGVCAMSIGAMIVEYEYSPADVVANQDSTHVKQEESVVKPSGHKLFAMCWRGTTRSINVMLGKTEIESMKHQLAALGVLRERIAAPKREILTKDSDEVVEEEQQQVDASEESGAMEMEA